MKNKKLNKNLAIIGILLIVALFVAACTNSATGPSTGTQVVNGTKDYQPGTASNTAGAGNTAVTPSNATAKVKLSDTVYSKYAHLISGDTIDANANAALAGFTVVKTTLSDGTTEIKLNSDNPEYTNHTYDLKPGQQLYFIETSRGDDSGNTEFNLGDDSGLIVDADGYIVK